MKRLMESMDELAGLDIVLARVSGAAGFRAQPRGLLHLFRRLAPRLFRV